MKTTTSKLELAGIFRDYGGQYREGHILDRQQHKAMEDIEKCRTTQMKGHVNKCDHCGVEEISYNSCRNRHCPKCGQTKIIKWIDKLRSSLPPIRYFHIVFTLPHDLNPIIQANQGFCFDLLFKSANGALQAAASNPEYLGAETGCIALLHTWGQPLMDHYHIHMIVPAGGLDNDGLEWRESGKKFFVPVKALSKMFRYRYLKQLEAASAKGEIKLSANARKNANLDDKVFVTRLHQLSWNVYSKKVFGNNSKLISYLGRYTNRVAITNSRILSIDEEGKVNFRWKDYSDRNRWKVMKLEPGEFIRRFLLHVLPGGYYKIRYFGIFASCNRKTKLLRCFELLGPSPSYSLYEDMPWNEIWLEEKGIDLLLCKSCKKGRMRLKHQVLEQQN